MSASTKLYTTKPQGFLVYASDTLDILVRWPPKRDVRVYQCLNKYAY